MTAPLPSTSAGPSQQTTLLGAFRPNPKALDYANDIRDVIRQVQQGVVQSFRDLYYAPRGKKPFSTDVAWDSIKLKITRRERTYAQLMKHFGGDEDRFFAFFTISADEMEGKKRKKGLQCLRPMRKLVEAITPMETDIRAVKSEARYQGTDSSFSQELWDLAWPGKNDWEVWRELGKERYGL